MSCPPIKDPIAKRCRQSHDNRTECRLPKCLDHIYPSPGSSPQCPHIHHSCDRIRRCISQCRTFYIDSRDRCQRPRECKFHHYSQKQIPHRDQLFTHSLQCPCRDLYDGQGKKTKPKKLQAGRRMNGTCLLRRIQQQQYRFR